MGKRQSSFLHKNRQERRRLIFPYQLDPGFDAQILGDALEDHARLRIVGLPLRMSARRSVFSPRPVWRASSLSPRTAFQTAQYTKDTKTERPAIGNLRGVMFSSSASATLRPFVSFVYFVVANAFQSPQVLSRPGRNRGEAFFLCGFHLAGAYLNGPLELRR